MYLSAHTRKTLNNTPFGIDIVVFLVKASIKFRDSDLML